MNMLVYRCTGAAVTLTRRAARMGLRITGQENIPDRPTLFVVNHFTRMETFLIPYIVYLAAKRPVHTLAHDGIFTGLLTKFWHAVGVMSTRDPERNRTIIRELATGSCDWVIYPEGGLVKGRVTTRRGRPWAERGDRSGPPHTGAALLALRAELLKRRVRDGWEHGDMEVLQRCRDEFGVFDTSELSNEDIAVVPITVTYHGLRPRDNRLVRGLRRLLGTPGAALDEELVVETSVLVGKAEVAVHFGKPIEVNDHLSGAGEVIRKMRHRDEVMLRRPARRLTDRAMMAVYGGVEISFDHLFCSALRYLPDGMVDRNRLHHALFLAATELRGRDEVRLHPVLRNGISALVCGGDWSPLEDTLDRAIAEGVVSVHGGQYRVHRERLDTPCGFNRVRLERSVEVLANEIEPLSAVVDTVRRSIRKSGLDERDIGRRIVDADRADFDRGHAAWSTADDARPADAARPYLLENPSADVGVVLVHGYLASPEVVRPLARRLHEAGHEVYAVCLPGHGTTPDHLDDVTWHDWVDSTTRGALALRTDDRPLVVVGLSLGGALGLIAASDPATAIDGVVAVNTPMRPRDKRFHLAPLLRAARGSAPLVNVSEMPEINYVRHSLHGVCQLHGAVRRCRLTLPKVAARTLVIQATHDPVVATSSGRAIRRRLRGDQHELVLVEDRRHVPPLDAGATSDRIAAFIDSFASNRTGT